MERDKENKVEINAHNGAQVVIAGGSATVYANQNNNNERKIVPQEIKSRTQEYYDKWNANMFLNDFSEWDENAGANVKLKDVYTEAHLPHFIWGDNKKVFTNLKTLLSQHVENKDGNKMLLILGQPGIGKSTLITWITANFSGRVDDILVYRFASDLGNVDWQNRRISNRVLEELGLNYGDISGKVLILDGFDEVSIESYSRRNILDNLYGDWIYDKAVNNFTLIITCRENYVPKFVILKCKYITLQPWNEKQIRDFCNIFQEKTKNKISESTIEKIIENMEILGIPLILYMVLALNISIDKEGSIVDVYDKIFSLDGGIYDRCIDNKVFADKHRIGKIKEQIHQISREIAIWIFENNADKAYITKKEYQIICNNIIKDRKKSENEEIERDFLIGNFFKLVKHCEGVETEQLYFIHRSIYEYFVTETIFCEMEKTINISVESLAATFGNLLKGNRLSITELEFLKHKIIGSELYNKFDLLYESFQLMTENGMVYYAKKYYKNIIRCESMVFINMLDIVHLWDKSQLELGIPIWDYLICNKSEKVNLKDMILNKIRISYTGIKLLYGISLRRVCLGRADLRNADLRQVDFTHAQLYEADLRHANLRRTDLKYADLEDADLRDAKVQGINLTKANLKGTIFNP